MKKVQVLMSTYNGSLFVAEQIESILNQTYPYVHIKIRDDGSTDSTIEILNDYAAKYPDRIHFEQGTNMGVIRSFLYLLEQSEKDADYYCFCDQDDFWLPHKIARAVEILEDVSTPEPAMVFTSTQIADAALNPLKLWPEQPSKAPSFYNALIQNVAVGATLTFNKEARCLLGNSSDISTDRILMHDWWMYLCVSAFGRVVFDPEPSILYRQHGNNVIGGEASFKEKLLKKWNSFRKHRGQRLLFIQAMEFHRLYGFKLKEEKKIQLELFLADRKSVPQRLSFLKKTKLYRQSFLEQQLFRFLILIGYI